MAGEEGTGDRQSMVETLVVFSGQEEEEGLLDGPGARSNTRDNSRVWNEWYCSTRGDRGTANGGCLRLLITRG